MSILCWNNHKKPSSQKACSKGTQPDQKKRVIVWRQHDVRQMSSDVMVNFGIWGSLVPILYHEFKSITWVQVYTMRPNIKQVFFVNTISKRYPKGTERFNLSSRSLEVEVPKRYVNVQGIKNLLRGPNYLKVKYTSKVSKNVNNSPKYQKGT